MGEQEDAYAHAIEDSRSMLKHIRNTERSVQPSRENRGKLVDEIARLKSKEPQSARLVILEQELVRAEAENLVAEAQLFNITRKSLKAAYEAEFLATIERAEKQIILARHGRRLLELLDEEAVVPGAAIPDYHGAADSRQIVCDCEDDLGNWRPDYRLESEQASSSTPAMSETNGSKKETAASPVPETTAGKDGPIHDLSRGRKTGKRMKWRRWPAHIAFPARATFFDTTGEPFPPVAMLSRPSTTRYICRRCNDVVKRSRTAARSYTSISGSKLDIYDVVCVGGGPAGLSLLTALRANPATAGLRVALVEAQDLSKLRNWSLPPNQYSNRCSSLTPSSAHFLDSIGAWSRLDRQRVQAYQEMQVWDGVTGARIEFDWAGGSAEAARGNTIAYMVENLNLTSGLLRRLEELGGVDVFDNASVEDIALGKDTEEMDLSEWPVVSLAGGRQLFARLLVGADGANSPVRSFAGIEAKGWDYDRHGVVATLRLEDDIAAHDSMYRVAYQRFLPSGPIASLPMPGNYSTLVWSTTPAYAALLKSLSPADFTAMVNAAFRLSPVDLEYMHTIPSGQADELAWRLQHATVDAPPSPRALPAPVVEVQEGSVASFPLRMRHADTYVGERVALVGDAAHTVHPLAGQGLNAGQGDVESLSRTIAEAVAHGQDLGTRMSLEPYEAERYAANHVILGVCDKLHKLYSVGSGPLVPLRSLGLSAVNAARPLKNFFMNQAAGNGFKLF
ncbi:hypothetical protein PpBr36_07625 [Pyricularia pennisetigena]|uniref:hypothetical protein n=1 Tax=Pyricularia pennisetigena TaxID=1578925 RepID=UPI001152B18B|nr:hypothetical protein PpBr36_07625 [Pyricularia pennisetigena]TLS25019.1 hypothetical protein PpBr36_07625 [Pyricularia pennisetigena]